MILISHNTTPIFGATTSLAKLIWITSLYPYYKLGKFLVTRIEFSNFQLRQVNIIEFRNYHTRYLNDYLILKIFCLKCKPVLKFFPPMIFLLCNTNTFHLLDGDPNHMKSAIICLSLKTSLDFLDLYFTNGHRIERSRIFFGGVQTYMLCHISTHDELPMVIFP